MAESSDGIGNGGGPPVPPKRPTIIRPQQTVKQSTSEQRPTPPRPGPPVPASRPPVPNHRPTNALLDDSTNHSQRHPHVPRINDGGVPSLTDKPNLKHPPSPVTKGSIRKRPEIIIVAAKPMSEVGFRSDSSSSVSSSRPVVSVDNAAFDDEPPPLPKRESSLEPEPKNPPGRPNPPILNKPLPPAPSSRPKFPSKPSQSPKPKLKPKLEPEPEVGLLIDFSDEIQVPTQPPLKPSSVHSPPAQTLRSPPPIPASPKVPQDSPVPTLPPPPVPRSHPIPAARSTSPVSQASNTPLTIPRHLTLLPNKPTVSVKKPRSPSETDTPTEIVTQEEQEAPGNSRPTKPTFIRPNKSPGPSTELQDELSKRINTVSQSTVMKSNEDYEPPEYAAIKPRTKSRVVDQKIEEPSAKNIDPPPVPDKLYNPKPTVLPKPRTSLISPQTEQKTAVDSFLVPEINNDKTKTGTKPTIIRPPPKPLRLHELEGNMKSPSENGTEKTSEAVNVRNISNSIDKENSLGPPPRPTTRTPSSVPQTESSKSPDQKTNHSSDSFEVSNDVSAPNIRLGKDTQDKISEQGPQRPKPPSPKQKSPPENLQDLESVVIRRPVRPGGPPPRPASAAPTISVNKDRDRPSRPNPPRPGPPKKIEKSPGSPPLPPRPTPTHQLYHYILTYPHGVAQHDYKASNPDEISFKEGDIIILTGRSSSEWLKGKIGQSEGIFPANFIAVIHPLHSEYPEPQDSPDFASAWTTPDWDADSATTKPDTGTGPRCRARFDFEGEGRGDLDFEEGDVIKLLKHVGSDWLQGELSNKVGIFPLSFVEIIEDLAVDSSMDGPNRSNIATTVFDFDGLEGELCFQAGQKVHVISEVNSEWLYGAINGKEGKFPATFVDHIPSNLKTYQSNVSLNETKEEIEKPTSVLFTCTAAHDYDSQQDDDLCFKTGDKIEVTEDLGDWLKGRLHHHEGIFPKSFIQIDNISDNEKAKALFDFIGESDNELTFKKGDVIILGEVVTGSPDWSWGDINGNHGIFPLNFVEVL